MNQTTKVLQAMGRLDEKGDAFVCVTLAEARGSVPQESDATGANRGLGFELAALAAERGHTVMAGVRDFGRLQEQLENRLDAILNNAEILLGRENPIETLGMDDVRNTFEVNLFGPINVVKHLQAL